MEILFLWLGLLLFALGWIVLAHVRMPGFAHRVPGRVIGYTPANNGTFAAVVAFEHPHFGSVAVRCPMATNSFPYPVGKAIDVRLNLLKQDRAQVDTPGPWRLGLALAVAGLGLAGIFFLTFRPNIFSVAAAVVVTASIIGKIMHRLSSTHPTANPRGILAALDESFAPAIRDLASVERELVELDQVQAVATRQTRGNRRGGAILVACGLGCLVLSFFWYQHRSAFLARALPARGQVVGFHVSSGKNGNIYYPEVEYGPQGDPSRPRVRFRNPAGSSHPSVSTGETVGVLYDPANPRDAMIDQGRWNRLAPLVPGLIGLVLLPLGLALVKS